MHVVDSQGRELKVGSRCTWPADARRGRRAGVGEVVRLEFGWGLSRNDLFVFVQPDNQHGAHRPVEPFLTAEVAPDTFKAPDLSLIEEE